MLVGLCLLSLYCTGSADANTLLTAKETLYCEAITLRFTALTLSKDVFLINVILDLCLTEGRSVSTKCYHTSCGFNESLVCSE